MESMRQSFEVGEEEMVLNTDELKDGILEIGRMLRSISIETRTSAHASYEDSVSLEKISENCIVYDSKLLANSASVYSKLKTAYSDVGWMDKLSDMSSKYEEKPALGKEFSDWCKSRKELIEITKSAAKELDQTLFIVNITRIVSSFAEVLNMLNLGIYQIFRHHITSCAYNISSNLGFITESALELAPYLRFMGFVSSFFEILKTQEIINDVVNAIRKDESSFLPIKEWLEETNELDAIVKKKFPYRINKEITISVEHAMEELGKEEKIFSATVLSNFMEDVTIQKNKTFMVEAFLFCISDTAKEWYKRMIECHIPLELESEISDFQKKSQNLEGPHIDSASKLELGKRTVEQMEYIITKNIGSFVGQCIVCCMNGMSVYYSLKNIRNRSRHMYSDKLRELSKSAKSFLNTMEKINF